MCKLETRKGRLDLGTNCTHKCGRKQRGSEARCSCLLSFWPGPALPDLQPEVASNANTDRSRRTGTLPLESTNWLGRPHLTGNTTQLAAVGLLWSLLTSTPRFYQETELDTQQARDLSQWAGHLVRMLNACTTTIFRSSVQYEVGVRLGGSLML